MDKKIYVELRDNSCESRDLALQSAHIYAYRLENIYHISYCNGCWHADLTELNDLFWIFF